MCMVYVNGICVHMYGAHVNGICVHMYGARMNGVCVWCMCEQCICVSVNGVCVFV